MKLLLAPPNPGYPTEYLLSRVRGRRSRLISDWKSLLFETDPGNYLASSRYKGFVRDRSPDGMWKNLLREYRWVYFQMNGELRRMFAPFFLYSEFRTLFICLRQLKDKKPGRCGELLDASLLSEEIKDVLSLGSDPRSALEGLEKVFLTRSRRFAGLAAVFETEGLRGAEQFITNTYLAVVIERNPGPLMQVFFARLIDARNILRLYKYFRYERHTRVPLIPGGTIPQERLRGMIDNDEAFALDSLVRKYTGAGLEIADAARAEMALYKGITRFLKIEGREPLGFGVILDYLWKCSIEVMNLSVLFSGRDLERETVVMELVQ